MVFESVTVQVYKAYKGPIEPSFKGLTEWVESVENQWGNNRCHVEIKGIIKALHPPVAAWKHCCINSGAKIKLQPPALIGVVCFQAESVWLATLYFQSNQYGTYVKLNQKGISFHKVEAYVLVKRTVNTKNFKNGSKVLKSQYLPLFKLWNTNFPLYNYNRPFERINNTDMARI